MLASFLDTIKSFSSTKPALPTAGDKRARDSGADNSDEDEVVITDVLQTPPSKRLKDREQGGNEPISNFKSLVSGIRHWSDRYIWRHVVGSRAPQSEPEILSEDLDQAEKEMDQYDILNSTAKPYPSVTNERRSERSVKLPSGLTRPPIASYNSLYQHEARSNLRQTSTFAQDDWGSRQREEYPQKAPIDLGESYLHYCPEKYKEEKQIEHSNTSTRPRQYSKEKYGSGRQKPHADLRSKKLNSSTANNGSEFGKAKLNFTIGQSSQDSSIKQARSSSRNSRGNRSKSRVISTAEEVVRLEERNRYRQVLSQFTSVTLPPDNSWSSSRTSFLFGGEVRDQQEKPRTRVADASRLSSKSVLHSPAAPLSSPSYAKPPTIHRVTASPTRTPGRSPANVFLYSKPEKSRTSIKDSSLTSSVSNSKMLDSSTSGPLGDDWTRKWREMVSEESLLRAREISKEERKLEAIRAKEREEQEALAQEIRERLKEQEKGEEEEEEDSFPELTDDMERKIDAALAPGYPDDSLANGFRITIKRSDIATLSNLNWLNDEIMNCYFTLITERSKEPGRCKVHAFNSFFYPKLVKTGYATLRRWTKKVDIFAVDIVAVPIHLGMHWCLAIIDMRKKCISYYDSLKGSNPQCLNALKNYLSEEFLDKKKQPFDLTGWTTATPKDIPEQLNGCDCGVFTCKYAEYITRDAAFNFDQRHMPYFRRRMVYEILTMKLL